MVPRNGLRKKISDFHSCRLYIFMAKNQYIGMLSIWIFKNIFFTFFWNFLPIFLQRYVSGSILKYLLVAIFFELGSYTVFLCYFFILGSLGSKGRMMGVISPSTRQITKQLGQTEAKPEYSGHTKYTLSKIFENLFYVCEAYAI